MRNVAIVLVALSGLANIVCRAFAWRVLESEPSDTPRGAVDGGDCESASLPKCSELKEWLKEKHRQGVCLAFDTPQLRCSLGVAPSATAYTQWNPTRDCGSYYQETFCSLRNVLGMDDHYIAKQCPPLVLKIKDCELLQDIIISIEAPEGRTLDFTLYSQLADALDDMGGRAKTEWMLVPSHRLAVEKVARGLDIYLEAETKLPSSGYEIGKFWRVLLRYCDGVIARGIKAARENHGLALATEDGLVECKARTKLDMFSKYHPAFEAALFGFVRVDTLQKYLDLGFEFLEEKGVWESFMLLAGSSEEYAAQSYQEMLLLKENLLISAADRGVGELELALQMDSFKPLGGQRRYDEMKARLDMKNTLAVNDNSPLSSDSMRARAEADDVLAHGPLQWVDPDEFDLLRARMADDSKYCSVQERSFLKVGIQVGFEVHGKCNVISCSVYKFFNEERLKLFSAVRSRGFCDCYSQVPGSPLNLTISSAFGCDGHACWRQYTKLLKFELVGEKRLRVGQDVDDMSHWNVECSAELLPSILPSLGQAQLHSAGLELEGVMNSVQMELRRRAERSAPTERVPGR